MNQANPFEAFEVMAQKCEALAQELELAKQHSQTMANHFRQKEVPRAAAHSLAAQGHLEKARNIFTEIAIEHSSKAQP